MKKYEIIEKILRNNNISAEVHQKNNNVVEVEISWGDWKHDHMRAKYLLNNAGFEFISTIVTEEDGSDTYSAVHFFK